MSTIWQMVRVMKLFEAAENGYLNEVKRLVIDWGVDPNVRERHGVTPLHYAARNGHLDVVEFLLEHGADPNVQDNDGKTPLHYATTHCNFAEASVLLDYGGHPT
jgi:FOG: Ankyrin repeat